MRAEGLSQDRNVVVTGAGSGIGRAAAVLFASRGDSLSCWDIREEHAQRTVDVIRAAGGEAEPIACDVSWEDDVRSAFRQVDANWGGADVLFVNAAIEGPLKPVSRGVQPGRQRESGRRLPAVETRHFVATSAGGIVALAKSLAVDHRNEGIRSNCVAPAV
ncbi:SDR family NAD(P)-dependent oxidoreductase [Rhodococcus opacus]|uniref:SDR family NAD(P)-dependent oxidoreductase n=1 Tax=Rhodococcus opacus TaxID=37919 RepID=UPI0034D15950